MRRMILVEENRHLVKRVRILLDEHDVTNDCDAFDVEEGVVRLLERSPKGGVKIEHFCPSCDISQPGTGMVTPRCPACRVQMENRACRSLHRGRVEVIPIHPEEQK